jgi:hypothetical protein
MAISGIFGWIPDSSETFAVMFAAQVIFFRYIVNKDRPPRRAWLYSAGLAALNMLLTFVAVLAVAYAFCACGNARH